MRCLVQQSSSAPMLEAGAEELQLGLLLFGEFDADGELTLTLTLTLPLTLNPNTSPKP